MIKWTPRRSLWFGMTLAALLAVVGSAFAQKPPIMDQLKGKLGLSVVKSFPTGQPGLTGYVIKDGKGRTGLVYGMGDYLFSGTLIDREGQNASRRFAQGEMPKPDYGNAAKKLSKDPFLVNEGPDGAPEVYVFADPNCIYCHKFWEMTRDWVKAGKIRMHWVMVGFLKSSSAGRAAAMMAAKNGAEAIDQDEASFDVGQEEGAIKPLDPIPEKLQKVLDRHGRLMAVLGFHGTPSLIYRNQEGNWVATTGVPQKQQWASALGIH